MKDIKEYIVKENQEEQLNEGYLQPRHRMDKNECYDYWQQAMEIMGAEDMVNEIFNYLDDNGCSWVIEELDKDHELGLF